MERTIHSLSPEEIKAEFNRLQEQNSQSWKEKVNPLLNKPIQELSQEEYERAIRARQLEIEEEETERWATSLTAKFNQDTSPSMDSRSVLSLSDEEIIREHDRILSSKVKEKHSSENENIHKAISSLSEWEYERAIDSRYKQIMRERKTGSLKWDEREKLAKEVLPQLTLEELRKEREVFMDKWMNQLMETKLEDMMNPTYLLLLNQLIKQKK